MALYCAPKAPKATSLASQVTRLELALKEQEYVLQRSEASKEESVASQLAMKAELSKTSQVLEDVRLQLQDARTASMLNSMRRLMEIEARGNMRLDRQSGRMAPVKPLDFRPSEPSKEAYLVTFANDSDVAKVLADMLEVTNIFDAGLQVSVSCKQGRGDAKAWQELATKRATLVKERIDLEHGAASSMASGLVIKATRGEKADGFNLNGKGHKSMAFSSQMISNAVFDLLSKSS